MLLFSLNIFSLPVEVQCVYFLIGAEFLNIISHFMLQTVAASCLHRNWSIQFISLPSNSRQFSFVSFPVLLGIITRLLTQAFLTRFHIFISSTVSACPPYCRTTARILLQQNMFEFNHLAHICVLHSFGLQVAGVFAGRLLSDYRNEGERRGYESWRCVHRASSYNVYINQQDAQNFCD